MEFEIFPAQSEKASPMEFGESSPVDFGRLSPAKLKGLSPLESNRLFPVKSQLKDHPQRSSLLSQTEFKSPAGLNITSNGNSSPAEFISGILSRAPLPHKVISLSVYSPTELSSPAGLFSQSSSFAIPSGNEEFNFFSSSYPRFIFPS